MRDDLSRTAATFARQVAVIHEGEVGVPLLRTPVRWRSTQSLYESAGNHSRLALGPACWRRRFAAAISGPRLRDISRTGPVCVAIRLRSVPGTLLSGWSG